MKKCKNTYEQLSSNGSGLLLAMLITLPIIFIAKTIINLFKND